MRWWVAPLAMLAGCGRCAHPTADVVEGSAAVDAERGTVPTDAATDAKPHARVPTREERKRYDDALGRGRAATVAKNYSDAITAFSEALAAIPSDARAMSERGYARFLSSDDKGAEKDFNAAIDEVPKSDKKLSAQIYFNLGLVAEKRGEPAGAYFRSSYEYNPTAAAKAKMSACPVIVATFDTYEDADSGVFEQARDAGEAEGVTPMFVDLEHGAYLGGGAVAFLPKPSGGFVYFPTGAKTMTTRPRWCCLQESLQDDVAATREGGLWVITVQPMVAGITPCPCGNCKPGEIIPDRIATMNASINGEGDGGEMTMRCEDSPISNEFGNCIPCGGTIDVGVGVGPELTPGGSREVFYVDAKTGDGVWHVTYDTEFAEKIKIVIEEERVLVVTGADCHVSSQRQHPK